MQGSFVLLSKRWSPIYVGCNFFYCCFCPLCNHYTSSQEKSLIFLLLVISLPYYGGAPVTFWDSLVQGLVQTRSRGATSPTLSPTAARMSQSLRAQADVASGLNKASRHCCFIKAPGPRCKSPVWQEIFSLLSFPCCTLRTMHLLGDVFPWWPLWSHKSCWE